MSHLSEHQILRFLVQITLMLVASRGLGDLVKRFGQAAVIGELISGVVLGPSIFGRIAPSAYQAVFAGDPIPGHLLEAFGWIGAILLLLFIGLETDLKILRGQGKPAAFVSTFGMAIPLASGLWLGLMLPANYLTAPGTRLIFALFMAVAMSVSAVPVIAKILVELGLMQRELGLVILGAGIIDDSVGWLMLSLVAGLAASGSLKGSSVAILLGETAAFVTFCYFIGARMVAWALRWVDDHVAAEHGRFSSLVVLALACAIVTQAIGLHAVFGGFVAGLMLSRSPRLRKEERAQLEAVTMGFLAPLFFAYSGMQANLSSLSSPGIPMFILAVACVAKLLGCSIGGLLGGLSWRETMAVAVGMNARGGMGIIVALLGLSLGILTPTIYTTLVMIAVLTSLATPPLLTWALGGVKERPADVERAERGRLMAQLPFRIEGAKLLVLSGGGPHSDLATHLAAALGSAPESSVTMFHANPKKAGGENPPANGAAPAPVNGRQDAARPPTASAAMTASPAMAASAAMTASPAMAASPASAAPAAATAASDAAASDPDAFHAQFARMRTIAETASAANLQQRIGTGESVAEAIIQETQRGYDAIFAGASMEQRRDTLSGSILRDLVATARVPVVVARGAGTAMPFTKVLVPISGARFSRLGAAIAMLYAHRVGATVTLIHVRKRPLFELPLISRAAPPPEGDEIVREIKTLGDYLGLEIGSRIGSGRSAESVILRELQEGGFDLLVMGALFHSAEQRLYFGPKVENILHRARCAVAIVAAPAGPGQG